MGKVNLQINIPVSVIKEGKSFVFYTPALDLSTSAKSYKKGQERFNEIIQIFFEEITKKGTFEEVLTSLGWVKAKNKWAPPVFVSNELQSLSFSYA